MKKLATLLCVIGWVLILSTATTVGLKNFERHLADAQHYTVMEGTTSVLL